jgi:NADH:ubiquinone oxidoreductase subunit 6 (subunit J)
MTAPQVYHRQYNLGEKTMKKIVIIGGSMMMLILFTLIFVVNIRDQEWHEEKLIAFCISTVGLVMFSSILVSYGIYHLRRERMRRNIATSSINVSLLSRSRVIIINDKLSPERLAFVLVPY